jgi:hypothetical protein
MILHTIFVIILIISKDHVIMVVKFCNVKSHNSHGMYEMIEI